MTLPNSALSISDKELIENVTAYVKAYMAHYDPSHDYNHILRVLGLARHIASVESVPTSSTPTPTPTPTPASPSQDCTATPAPAPAATTTPSPYDPLLITLCSLLHDIGDRKYLLPGEDGTTMIATLLLSMHASPQLAQRVQTICSAVSYSSEVRDRDYVGRLVGEFPELAVVQDADRLDAIGAVGVGRCFTFGGARGAGGEGDGKGKGEGTGRSMQESVDHFTEKLELLEGLMKTAEGRRLAGERTRRLKVFREWWVGEVEMAEEGLGEF